MSKYFQVLERLERGQTDTLITRLLRGRGRVEGAEQPEAGGSPRFATARTAASPAVALDPLPDRSEIDLEAEVPGRIAELRRRPSPKLDAVRLSPAAGAQQEIEALFNNLDAITKGQRPMTLVLAGASATDSVQAVAMSLAQYAERKGHRVLVADLSEAKGRSVVSCRYPADALRTAASEEAHAVQIDLRHGTGRETLTSWREKVRPQVDITLIVGPPLQESMDAALLASLCNGLVLVAVEGETHRAALTVAAERTRLTNTPTVGVVVAANRVELPPWLHRIVRGQVSRAGR